VKVTLLSGTLSSLLERGNADSALAEPYGVRSFLSVFSVANALDRRRHCERKR
jgi:hypothetical protein